MATDLKFIIENIRNIYDFNDKSVIQIGSGGGQLISCAKDAKSIIAVDNDPSAIKQLKSIVEKSEFSNNISIIEGTIDSVDQPNDLVFFEFCLHEMENPELVLHQAFNLAPEILVVDHHPDSAWSWYTCENQKATQSWSAVKKYSIIKKETFKAIQHFSDYSDLYSRLAPLGDLAIHRIQKFETQFDIEIDMVYTVAVLK